ncbi:MAG: hypothetical protein H6985_00315 [Pseudomonadales bacterium]|nr:hypothetical protein [Pseudomonadales bacterium]
MRQLSGLDASFLYLETANAPMHISSLAIYDQSTAPGGKVRFKEIVENTTNRIRRLPILTRHLLTVPLGLDHPYWVSDGSFDPEFHIRHIALPAPGDWRQLCILYSRCLQDSFDTLYAATAGSETPKRAAAPRKSPAGKPKAAPGKERATAKTGAKRGAKAAPGKRRSA